MAQIENEVCVLGSMLLDNTIIPEVVSIISADDFFVQKNKDFFTNIIKQYEKDGVSNIVTLTDLMGIQFAGDISELTDSVSSTANYMFYVQSVKDHSLARKFKDHLAKIQNKISAANIEEVLFETDTVVEALLSNTSKKKPLTMAEHCLNICSYIESMYKNTDPLLGFDTGFNGLNNITDGLPKGKCIILGARPSIGKTAFSINLMRNLVNKGIPCTLFSLEMSNQAVMERLVSVESGIPIYSIRHGMALSSTNQMTTLNNALNRITEYKLSLYDTNVVNDDLDSIVSKIRLEAKKGCKVFFVDHIGLVRHKDKSIKRYEQLGAISRKFLQLSQELDVTIVSLCQLRRDSEGHKPNLNDLRESGDLEQNADICMFLHRDRSDGTEVSIPTELIVIKNRDGNCGTANLNFFPKETLFKDVS